MVNIFFKRLRETDTPPAKGTYDSAGLDVYAQEDIIVRKDRMVKAETQLIIDTNPLHEYETAINNGLSTGWQPFITAAVRSSMIKKGLLLCNLFPVIDMDYCGEDDQIMFYLVLAPWAPQDELVIQAGERYVQLLVLQNYNWSVDSLLYLREYSPEDEFPGNKKGSRGGYGSTGR